MDNDTKISKVAPDSWKKVPTATFFLFFRVKFFINDISLLLYVVFPPVRLLPTALV